ncbi:MAG: phosphatase PAP2 family protein [Eubacteriales bacterium]|nr:phosphatase PAP2 family protein [Eubacteriales bacterium]
MKNDKLKMIGVMACLIIFSAIAYFVVNNEVLTIDMVILEKVNGLRTESLTIFLRLITYMANWQFITLICIPMLVYPRTSKSLGFPLSISALLSAFAYSLLKSFFQRIRPDIAFHLINQGGYSFPSGHSMTGLLFYGMLIYLLRKRLLVENKNRTIANLLTALFSFLVFLIGISRIYLGVHYPTDVLAGWSLGLAFLLLITPLIAPKIT